MKPRKYLQASQHPHPHLGKLLLKVLKEKHITKMELSKRLGVSFNTASTYIKQHSIQFGILWNIGVAINYDFLTELCNHYPTTIPRNEKSVLIQEILELKTQLLEAEKKCSFYEKIVMK